MKTEIYYFSGTGNTLAVAKDIAAKMEGKLIAVSSLTNKEHIKPDADIIGILFPNYYRAVLGGIPLIIRRFVEKLERIESKYIFAVCTYGFGGPDFQILDQLIQGKNGKLSASFAVKMPFYYLALSGVAVIKTVECEKFFSTWRKKLENIYQTVTEGKTIQMDQGNFFMNHLLVPIGKTYYKNILQKWTKDKRPLTELITWMDCNFQWNEKCSGCGICAKVCPVGNVVMLDSKPSWNHHCEQCCACVQWCPEAAIQFEGKSAEGKQFHNPQVKLSEFIRKENSL